MNQSQGNGGNPGSSMPGWHQWDNQGHEPGTAAQTNATGQGGWTNGGSGVAKDLGGGMGGTGISDGGGASGVGHLQDDGSNPSSITPSLMQPGTQPGALLQKAGNNAGGGSGTGGGKSSGGNSGGSNGPGNGGGVGGGTRGGGLPGGGARVGA